jgi:hypothetical protein
MVWLFLAGIGGLDGAGPGAAGPPVGIDMSGVGEGGGADGSGVGVGAGAAGGSGVATGVGD